MTSPKSDGRASMPRVVDGGDDENEIVMNQEIEPDREGVNAYNTDQEIRNSLKHQMGKQHANQ